MRRRSLIAAALAAPAVARAQAWAPDRPMRWVVNFPAGGATDIWARMAAEPMAAELGQPIVIENRGGAGGMVGAEAVAKGPADGYTLLFTITSLVQSPVVLRRWPYDPIRDFAPIGKMGGTPLVFVTRPESPARTLEEFVRWARGRDLSFGSYSPGSTGHAFGQLFSDVAGLGMTHIAYRGEAPMLQDMLGGRIACGFHSMTGAGNHIRAGTLRPLASIGTQRVPTLPDLPRFTELGYSAEFGWGGFVGLLAPARTPPAAVARLAASFRRAMEAPEMTRRLLELDTLPQYLGPDDFLADIARCLEQWQALTTRMNLTAEG